MQGSPRAATPRETAKTEVAMRDIEVEEERVGKWISLGDSVRSGEVKGELRD